VNTIRQHVSSAMKSVNCVRYDGQSATSFSRRSYRSRHLYNNITRYTTHNTSFNNQHSIMISTWTGWY